MEEQYSMITKTSSSMAKNPNFLRQEDNQNLRSNLWLSKKKKNQVFLEGYVESNEEEDQEQGGGGSKNVSRTVSLTDEDLDELKGCIDLGFGFNYEEIPELCNTLPALELCYSMSQRFLDEQSKSLPTEAASSSSVMATDDACSSSPNGATQLANWKISSPGDHPEEVKARLKYWAQAVACTVKLCS
ncbi:putative signal transducer/transcription protein [Thalictrum thalictroides]|uniref:Putative signal transducer/transcription protein n=1 Tax=Thalictrum thalictroides TaxID=46969 RepID=A0A7J6VAM9_THATH|nr:putative signal transducer/transcription protein [Thalictrum thalictroides]